MMGIEELPDPDLVALDAARKVASDIVDRAASDASVAFTPDVLAAFVLLRNRSTPEYIALEQKLHAIANFPKGAFRDSLRAAGKASVAREEQGRKRTPDWQTKLIYANGKPASTCANLVTALMHAPEWRGVLAFDEMANNVVTRKPPPWFRDDAGGSPQPGAWTDADGQRLANWFARSVGADVSESVAHRAAHLVSLHDRFHPVRDYLNGLAWDGRPRVTTWLRTYLGATQPDEYLQRVGTWFLVAMVARAFEPGCQADHAVVFEGAQGAGKSSIAKALARRPEWYSEHTADLADKDAALQLAGRWVIELAELDSLSRAEVGKQKRFISQATDKFRPPYATSVAAFPRSCVFVGTVNDAEYLRDSTGNRRFWPVAVGKIDLDAFEPAADQLLAEAVFLHRSGARHWPDQDDINLLTNEQEQRRIADPWEGIIETWLETWLARPVAPEGVAPTEAERFEFVTMDGILGGAIGLRREDRDERHALRAGKILARLGWKRGRSRRLADTDDRETSEKRRRSPVYFPPEAP